MKKKLKKVVVKEKQATFSVSSDGFSIHTIEIGANLTQWEYKNAKEFLYESGSTYKERDESGFKCHICRAFAKQGIHNIRVIYNEGHIEYERYRIVIVLNPRKIIDPDSSYLGIFTPSKENFEKLIKAFRSVFKGTGIQNDLNLYQLLRVDLCVNIHCDNGKIFRELVRVLRKLPTPSKYERVFKKTGSKQERTLYNKHYIKFCCGTHNLVIYDKTYQMEVNRIRTEYEHLPEGVLRIEMCCLRTYLRKIEKREGLNTTEDLLCYMAQNSRVILTDKISHVFPHWRYHREEYLKNRVWESRCSDTEKARMLELIEKMQRKQSFERAFEDMGLTQTEGKKLLERFERLGISPVPLWKNFCAWELADLVELLNQSASGQKIQIPYKIIKYR